MNHDDTVHLVQRCRDLIDIESVSRNEADLESHLSALLPVSLKVAYKYDSVLFVTPKRRANHPLVVFAGHTDTVPVDHNVPSIISRDEIIGRGASDMKSGLAVMIELARWIDTNGIKSPFDIGFLFFGREELAAAECPLLEALEHDAFEDIDLAVVMEPTDNAIEAGCMGNMNLTVRFDGQAAHSARPWQGKNAAHIAITALHDFATNEPIPHVIDGLTFTEVASITGVRGGIALNVIPPTFEADINIRYAPDHAVPDVEREWKEYFKSLGAHVTITSNAHSAPVVLTHPLVEKLQAVGNLETRAKQAWTNVSDFAQRGIPAINFGPGDPAYAHKQDERVTVGALERSLDTLKAFVSGS